MLTLLYFLCPAGGSGLTPKNWRRRWFVLKGPHLYYYKTAFVSAPHVWVCLWVCTVSMVSPKLEQRSYAPSVCLCICVLGSRCINHWCTEPHTTIRSGMKRAGCLQAPESSNRHLLPLHCYVIYMSIRNMHDVFQVVTGCLCSALCSNRMLVPSGW